MVATGRRDTDYAMGSTAEEERRLIEQAGLLEEWTRRMFRDAGIGPGMRVLDVGCGVGDVSFLAASLVGAGGEVVGVDTNPCSLASAERRAAERGLTNVAFVQRDVRDFEDERPFDAVVGRAILAYLEDPTATVRKLADQVRPGGIVAFQDYQFDYLPFALPPVELMDQFQAWFMAAFRQVGVETSMGLKLYDVFVQAGLPAPKIDLDIAFMHPTDERWLGMAAQVLRSILPLMERLGVATAAEVDVDTFTERLRHEIMTKGAVCSAPPMIRAWTRTAVRP